jgi:hypothetical protein
VSNGNLICLSEEEGFELLITTDRNLRYQQNLRGRTLPILVLSTTIWPRIRLAMEMIVATIRVMSSASHQKLLIP